MDKLIKLIGILVFTALMYIIPIAVTLSFVLNWSSGIQLALVVLSLLQFSSLFVWIYMEMDDGE